MRASLHHLCAATAESKPPESKHVMRPAVFGGSRRRREFSARRPAAMPGRNFNTAGQFRNRLISLARRGPRAQLIDQVLPDGDIDFRRGCEEMIFAAFGAHRERRKLLAANFLQARAQELQDRLAAARTTRATA